MLTIEKKTTRFSSLEVQAVVTSKAVWDLCKLPFHLLTQENIRRLCSQTNASLWRVRRNKDILYYTILYRPSDLLFIYRHFSTIFENYFVVINYCMHFS